MICEFFVIFEPFVQDKTKNLLPCVLRQSPETHCHIGYYFSRLWTMNVPGKFYLVMAQDKSTVSISLFHADHLTMQLYHVVTVKALVIM